jgi:hypothetical protein
VLCAGNRIAEAGPYRREIGERILRNAARQSSWSAPPAHGAKRTFPASTASSFPRFVKAHGHDHESPIIESPKTGRSPCGSTGREPLRRLHRGATDRLTAEFGCSPNLISYRKARLDDVSYGITSALTHHCNFNKYHVGKLVQANAEAGRGSSSPSGARPELRREGSSTRRESGRADGALREGVRGGGARRLIPGPDQFFSNGRSCSRGS